MLGSTLFLIFSIFGPMARGSAMVLDLASVDSLKFKTDTEDASSSVKKVIYTTLSKTTITSVRDGNDSFWTAQSHENCTHVISYKEGSFNGVQIFWVDSSCTFGLYNFVKESSANKWTSVQSSCLLAKIAEFKNKLGRLPTFDLELFDDDDDDDSDKQHYKTYNFRLSFEVLDSTLFVPNLKSKLESVDVNYANIWSPKSGETLLNAYTLNVGKVPVIATLTVADRESRVTNLYFILLGKSYTRTEKSGKAEESHTTTSISYTRIDRSELTRKLAEIRKLSEIKSLDDLKDILGSGFYTSGLVALTLLITLITFYECY